MATGEANWGQNAPESQTLIVLSKLPDTIVLPSGEKATEVIQSLWALVFSLFSSSVAVRTRRSGQLWLQERHFGAKTHPNPRL